VNRPQATQNATQTPPDRKYYNCEKRGHYFNGCPNPYMHRPSVLIMNITLSSSEKTAKFCFLCGQKGHFALQCPNRCQRQTPPDKKCYNCVENRSLCYYLLQSTFTSFSSTVNKDSTQSQKRFYVSQNDHVMFQLCTGWSFCQSMPQPASTIDPNPRQPEYDMNSDLQEMVQLWTKESLC
jgi:hypothetical protein